MAENVVCDICGKLGDSKTLFVDIVSGCERGMICKDCLMVLSLVGNSKKILERALFYLADWEMKDKC